MKTQATYTLLGPGYMQQVQNDKIMGCWNKGGYIFSQQGLKTSPALKTTGKYTQLYNAPSV